VVPQSSIEIEVHSRESCVITLHGEHDAATSDGVTLALALARDYACLLVDLTPCTFLDGTVINALLHTAKDRRAGGARLAVAVRRPSVAQRTLELCGALTLIPAHESRAAGIEALAQAERAAGHARPVSLRAVTAEIDHFNARNGARPKRPLSKRRGMTVLRAQVTDSTSDALERERRRAA
jgi:anti-anti-sigma factor